MTASLRLVARTFVVLAEGSQVTTYRYTGQRWDSGTGLYFYNARWYDPAIGRFLAADTIVPNPGDPMSLNRYMYVRGNPIRYTDPSGHAECVSDDCSVFVHPVSGQLRGIWQKLNMQQKWGIIMKGAWETANAWTVFEGMSAIAVRVGNELGSREQGDGWVQSVLGGTEFVRWQNDSKPIHPISVITRIHSLVSNARGVKSPWENGTPGLALPAHYPLLNNDVDTIYFFDTMDGDTPVHEAGHIIDYRNDYVSINMARIVTRNESPTDYGTTNQIEDFAESWKYWVYNREGLTIDRRTFIESLVVQWR